MAKQTPSTEEHARVEHLYGVLVSAKRNCRGRLDEIGSQLDYVQVEMQTVKDYYQGQYDAYEMVLKKMRYTFGLEG